MYKLHCPECGSEKLIGMDGGFNLCCLDCGYVLCDEVSMDMELAEIERLEKIFANRKKELKKSGA